MGFVKRGFRTFCDLLSVCITFRMFLYIGDNDSKSFPGMLQVEQFEIF